MFAKRRAAGRGWAGRARRTRRAARRLRRDPDEPSDSVQIPDAEASARRTAALCGLMTVLGFAGFGLTQVMFAHNNGNMMYLLTVTLWLACSSPGTTS